MTIVKHLPQATPKRELSDTELRVRSMTKANDPRRGKGKRILQEHRAELNSIVTAFLRSIPQNGTVDDYTEQYLVHNNRWKQHCQNMNKRYEWMNADATLFDATWSWHSAKCYAKNDHYNGCGSSTSNVHCRFSFSAQPSTSFTNSSIYQ